MNPSSTNKMPTEDKSPKTKANIEPKQIQREMKILCTKNVLLGVVDHMQGPATIKLKKDLKGVHHYIPLSWVTRVDDKVHIDRPGEQAMREWSNDPLKS